jgi:hypothetical protein
MVNHESTPIESTENFTWVEGEFELGETTTEPALRRGTRWAAIPLMLILLGVATLWWAQSDQREITEQVKAPAVQEGATDPMSVVVPSQVRATDFRGGMATVEVVIEDPVTDAYAQRQTWFYQRGGDSWERIAAEAAPWGEWQEKQTEHFRFIYLELDREAVELLAAEAETLLADLLAGLGIDGAGMGRTFTVEVVPESFPAQSGERDWIRLSSPRLQMLHPSQTDRDALAWELGRRLAGQLLREVGYAPGVTSPNTRFMLSCLAPPAIAQRWAPMSPRTAYDRQQYLQALVSWSGWPAADMSDMGRWPSTGWRKPQLECSTFGDFIVERFGYDKLGELVETSRQTYGWEQVVERGLGMGYREFLSAWRAFVEERVSKAQEPTTSTPFWTRAGFSAREAKTAGASHMSNSVATRG